MKTSLPADTLILDNPEISEPDKIGDQAKPSPLPEIRRWIIFVMAMVSFLFSPVAKADVEDFVGGASLGLADGQFVGEHASDAAGLSVASAGDVNGDGYDDILIGAPFNDNAGSYAGATYLIYGAATPPRTIDLSMADAIFEGENPVDQSGYSVSGAGDVNGDGYADILIGAITYGDSGAAFLVYGSATALSGTISLSMADVLFEGASACDYAGYSVAGPGDVNGDGYADILIGAPVNNSSVNTYCHRPGTAYLVYGGPLYGTINLSSADAVFEGENDDDQAGASVTGAGDINRDGYDDILIGAPGVDEGGIDAGKVYLFNGGSISGNNGLATADASFVGESANEEVGQAISGAGDVNGDWYDDLLIGTNDDTYLFLGSRTLSGSMDISAAEVILNDNSYSVSGGDINADGLSDIIIGEGSEVYLRYGYSGISGSIDVATADAIFYNENSGDMAGYSVTASGDFDGDGWKDILIGAYSNDDGGVRAGKVYLITGGHCNPDDAIYVDTYLGSFSGPGGSTCPYATIQDGIDAAIYTGIGRVIVRGGFYDEVVTLEDGIELIGELKLGFLPPFIMSTSTSDTYLVEGANEAALQNFVIYDGGIHFDGINEMILQENMVYNDSKYTTYDLFLENGASDNIVENNIFWKKHSASAGIFAQPAVVYLSQNSDGNYFANNSMHARDYSGINYYDDVIGVYLEDYTEDNEFRNNIIDTLVYSGSSGTRYGFYTEGTNVTATIDYNKTPLDNLGVTMGIGNVVKSELPRFVNAMPYGFDYTLQSTSVCIDAGDPDAAYNDPDGTANDMGAFGGPNYLDFAE